MVHFDNNLGFPLTTNILEQMQTDREVCSKAVAGLLPNGATNGIIPLKPYYFTYFSYICVWEERENLR